ncbi:hypothetical protein [Neobacillus bataviensis]|nr:hypothetical protein [Neobacillus bataviensis]
MKFIIVLFLIISLGSLISAFISRIKKNGKAMKQLLFSIGSFFMIFISGNITNFNTVLAFVLLGVIIIFLILSISSMVQKNGKSKKYFFFSLGTLFMFVVFIIFGSNSPVVNKEKDKNSDEVSNIQKTKGNLNNKNENSKKPDTSIDKKNEWTQDNTDQIYYTVGRYSENGKYVVMGKYTLTPAEPNKLEEFDLKNRGFNKDLDNKILIVDSSFFGGNGPRSQFDIYSILWKSGSRDKAISVDIAHRDTSRGW